MRKEERRGPKTWPKGTIRDTRDPKLVYRAIVDMRDDLGSVHHTLYSMQNVMDDC